MPCRSLGPAAGRCRPGCPSYGPDTVAVGDPLWDALAVLVPIWAEGVRTLAQALMEVEVSYNSIVDMTTVFLIDVDAQSLHFEG